MFGVTSHVSSNMVAKHVHKVALEFVEILSRGVLAMGLVGKEYAEIIALYWAAGATSHTRWASGGSRPTSEGHLFRLLPDGVEALQLW